jgi:hypothetical protein
MLEAPKQANAICGWCDTGAQFDRVTDTVVMSQQNLGSGGQRTRISAAYLCQAPKCGLLSILYFNVESGRWGTAAPALIAQLPRAVAKEMEGLPDLIERDRLEAWSCFHGGDVRAAVLMARAAVQRAVRSLEAKGPNLKAELADLLSKQKITQDLHDFADEVRLTGNDVAHPEELGDVSEGEAQESMTFMEDFLRVAIALPQRQKERKAKRESAPNGQV